MKNSFLLLVFFLFGTSAQSSGENYLFIDKCEIQVNGENISTLVYVYVGSSISLQCICSNNETVEWYYNGSLMENTSIDIVLRSVSQSDSGLYSCIEQEQNMTYEINITVYCKLSLCYFNSRYSPPLAINITGNYTDLQVGSTTNITCQTDPIIPDVTIIWYNFYSNKITSSIKLTLSPVTPFDHNILYTCVLQSNMYPSLENKSITVTVQGEYD